MPNDSSDEKTRVDSRTPDPSQRGSRAPSATGPGTGAPQIPDHQLLRKIGAGSYGEVWLARNVMGTYRAVKCVYRKTFSSDRPYEREFTGIQKFEPISRSHEGLVDVLQIGRNDPAGYFYYVMELADDASASFVAAPVKTRSDLAPQSADVADKENGQTGQRETGTEFKIANRKLEIENPDTYVPKTLSKALHDRGRLPVEECLELSLTLTKALGHLHQHGLIHRDIKPSNIIFVNGIPKLADIGLVADVGEALSFVGTEGFIPPEGPGTAQADIYSLGKVIYELCTGKDRQDFPELPTLMGDGDDRTELLELNEVVLKACENDVNKRYRTTEEMHADLVLMQSGKSLKHFRTVERRLALLIRWGVAAAVAVALGFGAYHIRQQQQQEILARDLQLQQTKLEARERELQLTKRLADSTTHSALRLVEELFSADNSSAALAQLANIVRQDPRNKIATQRLLSALSQRSFAIPTIKPLRHDNYVLLAQFSKDGQRVATQILA